VDILRATALADGAGNTKLYCEFEANVGEVLPCYNGSWVAGKVGNYAIDLPGGTSAYINSANVSDLGLATGTMAFWMKVGTTGVHRGLAGVSDPAGNGAAAKTGFMMTRATSNVVWCYVGDGGSAYAYVSAGTVASIGGWNHYAMTWDASGGNITSDANLKAYINGVDTTSGFGMSGSGVTPGGGIASQELTIATTWRSQASLGLNNGAVDGPCDEFAVWNTSLSAANIASLYNSGNGATASSVNSANLVLHYSFEEGPGNSTIIDRSTNGNDHIGTLNSMTAGTPC
jgi:hypothetical protein